MSRYIFTRLLRVIPVLVIVTLLLSILLEFIPGNAAQAVLGLSATPETIHELEHKMGIDEPLPTRYLHWLGNAVHGDLGESMIGPERVKDVIKDRFPISLEIALFAQIMALVLAMVFGMWASARAGSRLDRSVMGIASAVQSMPSFCFAVIGIILFAIQRQWFPVSGFVRLTEDPVQNLKCLVLPGTSLALVEAAAYIRVLRTDVVTTLNEDFVLCARAKGLPDRRVVFRHALRPSSFGLVTIAGVTMARLIGGTVVIESLFSIPGLGSKLLSTINLRDYTMVLGIAAFLAVLYVLLSVAVEVLYALLDPRVRARTVAS